MAFFVNKDKLLRVLRSDITVPELKNGRSDPLLLEESTAASSSSNSRPTSPDSIEGVVIHTHEDLVSSLTKQLEIQQQVNAICEEDLQYRTEIIELLSSRVTQLEMEAASWEQQKQSFTLLKKKAAQLEAANAIQDKNESTSEPADIIPEGHVLIESSYLDSLKTQIATSIAAQEDWNIRVEQLELHLRKEKDLKNDLKIEVARKKEEIEAAQKASEHNLQDLRAQIVKLERFQVDATTEKRELNKSIDTANEKINKLVLDIVAAEQTRDSALASASAETREYAILRGRLSELEGQLALAEREREDLKGKLSDSSNQLTDTNEKLSHSNGEISRLENELTAARTLISQLQVSMAEAAETSKREIAELQEKLQTLTSESDSKIATLQQQLNLAQSARDDAEESISTLKAKIGQFAEDAEKDAHHIQELEQTLSTRQERITTLEAEIASTNQKHQEVVSSKEAIESALSHEVAGLQEKLSEDASKSAGQISELESTIIVIRQQCELHTAELTQTKEAVVEKDSQLSKLSSIEHEAGELKNVLHDRDQTVNELREQLSTAESKIHDLETRLTAQNEELDQLKKDHSRNLAEYQGRLEEMTTGATTNASRHAVLENEVSSLTSKLTALEADLLAAHSERDKNQKEHEEYVDSTSHQHDSEMFEVHGQMESLEEQLRKSQETCATLEAQLAKLQQSSSTEGAQSGEAEKQLEASLREAEDKVVDLQLELDTKNASLAEWESKANKATELESQVKVLSQELDSTKAKSETEVSDLRTQLADLKNQIAFSEQARSDLKSDLAKVNKEIEERQTRINILEKEARDNDNGGRSSVDFTELESLRSQHEKEIVQMEESFDELRIERDGIAEERDNAIATRNEQLARFEELQKRIQELEASQTQNNDSQSVISSPMDIVDLNSPNRDVVQELQTRLRDSEERREAAERALLNHRRTSSMASATSQNSRDSVIVVEDIDEHGNSEIREIKKIETDAGSDTASDITAENSFLASLSMASTTSSQAEFEAAKARAEQVEGEHKRFSFFSSGKDKEMVTPEKSKRLSRHDSARSSHSGLGIAAALGGASRMVTNITHGGEGHHLFPQFERTRTVSGGSIRSTKSKEHHHHDMSNPFMFFGSRERSDSMRSALNPLASSTSSSRSNSGPTSPPKATSPPHTPTTAMLEREKKAKDKAEKAERERAEKAAKIEREKAEKAEKAARKEKERLEREQKEKERKARAKRESSGGDSMKQGTSS